MTKRNIIFQSFKENKFQLIPLSHFILSFLYSSTIFLYDIDFMKNNGPVVINNCVSTFMEYSICLFLTKFFALIIIFSAWNIIFYLIRNRHTKSWISIAIPIFIIGLIIVFINLPESFSYEVDNFINYSYAIRYLPHYWHHIFTSCFYGACLTFIPNQFSIGIVQWIIFISVFFYFYDFLVYHKQTNKKLIKLLYAIFLFPDTYMIILNPYRNCLYAIISSLFFILIFKTAKIKEFSFKRFGIIFSLGILVALWRSEGIVLGILGFGFFCMICNINNRRKVKSFFAFLLTFIIFSVPQKIGDKKYYGSDYMIINTIRPLQFILRNKDNISYAHAEEDFAIIDKFYPLDVISQHGIAGYWDINIKKMGNYVQTSLSRNDTKLYMKAYYSLLLHCPQYFVKSQLSFFLYAIGIPKNFYIPNYTGPDNKLGSHPNVWSAGENEYNTTFVKEWEKSKLRARLNNCIDVVCSTYILLIHYWQFIELLPRTILIFSMIFIFFYEIYSFIRRKKDFSIIFLFIPFLWLSELCMIFLFMPDGRTAYLYPFFLNAFFILFYFVSLIDFKHMHPKELIKRRPKHKRVISTAR